MKVHLTSFGSISPNKVLLTQIHPAWTIHDNVETKTLAVLKDWCHRHARGYEFHDGVFTFRTEAQLLAFMLRWNGVDVGYYY